MTVLLAGANPAVTLSEDGEPTVFASLWSVDWSVAGRGTALVVWHRGAVRVLTTTPTLGTWLERTFVRHFPETEHLPWPTPTVEATPVTCHIDLATGVTAHAADVTLTMSDPMHHRPFTTDAFPLDGVPHGLTLLLAPMRTAAVTIGGTPVPGRVTHTGPDDRPTSSAFATTAEVWTREG
ncbi:hypothetical protein UO65_6062 [Actinokineospora spheciospongiae]|uniref:Uncharacterized protein n=1 Tax=Actinokineospora spheciospongiae TaxID=909613 RepID=W7IDV4_9PSEU|nr:hypothetical protein [Actinokineospora spheciospongiae]EWC58708.1 hypothetical protein UO65_6062 [Actinokineospora spheciospongiae]